MLASEVLAVLVLVSESRCTLEVQPLTVIVGTTGQR